MKSISDKQLAANRDNAKSGGVRSQAGKQASRLNAMRHGLLSREIVLPTEKGSDLLDLEKRMRADLRPVGELELMLVDRLVSGVWRLRRAMAIERSTMQHERKEAGSFGMGTTGDEEREKAMLFGADMDGLVRYETAIERGIYRALHELQRVQAARSGERPPAPIAVDIDTG